VLCAWYASNMCAWYASNMHPCTLGIVSQYLVHTLYMRTSSSLSLHCPIRACASVFLWNHGLCLCPPWSVCVGTEHAETRSELEGERQADMHVSSSSCDMHVSSSSYRACGDTERARGRETGLDALAPWPWCHPGIYMWEYRSMYMYVWCVCACACILICMARMCLLLARMFTNRNFTCHPAWSWCLYGLMCAWYCTRVLTPPTTTTTHPLSCGVLLGGYFVIQLLQKKSQVNLAHALYIC